MNQELMTLDFWQDTVIYEGKTFPIGTLACDATLSYGTGRCSGDAGYSQQNAAVFLYEYSNAQRTD